ncbi:MAG: BCCT family transporter [Desulfobulbaceae bacterium]|nr:BCCT family transporter [Desulfobulbaceae bacterium]
MENNEKIKIDWPVFGISGGILVLFTAVALINVEFAKTIVNKSFAFSCTYFGAYWQVLLLLTFLIAIGLACTKYGNVRIGNLDKPEMSTFRWISIIMCTLLAGGGVFWSAAEPLAHFLSPPPSFGVIAKGTKEAVVPAMAQGFLHWGFLAWSILGSLAALPLMYYHYHKGLALKPRLFLYPVFGKKVMSNWLGVTADATSLVAVAAGTIGPIGFLGLQLSYALSKTFGIPDTYGTQFVIIAIATAIYAIAACTGIQKGIDKLARFNVFLTIFVIGYTLILGPGGFIIDTFLGATGTMFNNFFTMTLYRTETGWLSWWTVFFWGWFLGYGPMMAILVARISRGRSVREIILAISILAPFITNFWFSVLGGSGIFYELTNPGSVSTAFASDGGFNLPAALMAIVSQFPFSQLMVPVCLVLVLLFLVTTGSGMAFSMAVAVTGVDEPPQWIRAFWAISMGAVAAALIFMGAGGIGALQSFIVVTAVPVGLLMLPTLYWGPKVCQLLYDENKAKNANVFQYPLEGNDTTQEATEKVAG